jgi:hypothetical protein
MKRISQLGRTLQLSVTANIVPSPLILSVLMMEKICSSGTSVLIRAIRRHIPEDGILHSSHRENIKSYRLSTDAGVYAIKFEY